MYTPILLTEDLQQLPSIAVSIQWWLWSSWRTTHG